VVAGVVKLDDLGIYLAAAGSKARQAAGRFILRAAPYLMKSLSFVGTVAMFLVGGGIITHGVGALHHLIESAEHAAHAVPGIGTTLAFLAPAIINMVVGLVVGAAVLALVSAYSKVFRKNAPAH
jgi:predicted DNA repair protein MutK